MRKILQLLAPVLCIVASCSSGPSQKENKYLGKIPSMVADFQEGQKKLEEKTENSEDFGELTKLDKELKDFRKGYDEKMEVYLSQTKALPPIPVKTISEKLFKIKNTVINALGTNNLNLKLTLDVTDEVPIDTPGRQIGCIIKLLTHKETIFQEQKQWLQMYITQENYSWDRI